MFNEIPWQYIVVLSLSICRDLTRIRWSSELCALLKQSLFTFVPRRICDFITSLSLSLFLSAHISKLPVQNLRYPELKSPQFSSALHLSEGSARIFLLSFPKVRNGNQNTQWQSGVTSFVVATTQRKNGVLVATAVDCISQCFVSSWELFKTHHFLKRAWLQKPRKLRQQAAPKRL